MMKDNGLPFPIGSYSLHENPNFNFQLNRTLQWSGGDLAELRAAAKRIMDLQSWEKELLALGEKAFAEKRVKNAIAYFRMAEFFMCDDNPDKLRIYDKARELFYDYYSWVFTEGKIIVDKIPYEQVGFLQTRNYGFKKCAFFNLSNFYRQGTSGEPLQCREYEVGAGFYHAMD